MKTVITTFLFLFLIACEKGSDNLQENATDDEVRELMEELKKDDEDDWDERTELVPETEEAESFR